jgi:hypothetical protein
VSYNFAFHYNRIKSPYLSVTSKSFYVLVPTSLPALPPILLPQHLHFLQALVTSCCSFPKTHTVFRLFSLPESHLFFLTLNTCLLDLCFLNSSCSILGLSSQGSSSTKLFQTFQSKLPLPSTFPFCLVFFFNDVPFLGNIFNSLVSSPPKGKLLEQLYTCQHLGSAEQENLGKVC